MSRRTRSVAVAVNAWNDDAREIVAQPSELAVLRPEIVAPLADAVRLVDGDEAHAALLQHPPEALAALADQPLGRHVEQPAAILAQRWRGPRRARAAVSVLFRYDGRDAVDAQAVDLILHQRDERRHDQREAAARRRQRRVGGAGARADRPAPAPGSRATCRRRSAGRRRCRGASRTACIASRCSGRKSGEAPDAVERVRAGDGDQRPGVVVLDVVVDQPLELRRQLVVGAAQRRHVLAVDEDRDSSALRRCRAG